MQQDINMIHNDRALITTGTVGVSSTVVGGGVLAGRHLIPIALKRIIAGWVLTGSTILGVGALIIGGALLAYHKIGWN